MYETKKMERKLVYSRLVNLSKELTYKELINWNKNTVLGNLGNFYTSNITVKNKENSTVC
jgi:hypothetical protein